jgi:hypothetical protein
MALIKQDGRKVTQEYIDEHFHTKSVLLLYHGEVFTDGGYLEFSSNASTTEEAERDTQDMIELLVNKYKSDGILASGFSS